MDDPTMALDRRQKAAVVWFIGAVARERTHGFNNMDRETRQRLCLQAVCDIGAFLDEKAADLVALIETGKAVV